MQNAPSVVYPVGRSIGYGAVIGTVCLVSGIALGWGCWSSWQAAPSHTLWGRWTLGFAVWLSWSLGAGWFWLHQPIGALKWDATATPRDLEAPPGAWFWLAQAKGFVPETVEPEVVFDGQALLLLRLSGGLTGSRWAWLDRSADRLRWDEVRRALVAAR